MNTAPLPESSQRDSKPHRSWSTIPWAPFVVPFLVYAVIAGLEPAAPSAAAPPEPNWLGFTVAYEHYPLIYTLKIAATIAALAVFWPAYLQFPFRIDGLAIAVGIVGGILWIALTHLRLEPKLLGPLGLGGFVDAGARPAFNPFEQLRDHPAWAYGFLAIRFLGLVLVVPMMEELFLRGFLMRFVMHANWPQIPFGEVNRIAIAVGTIFPMLYHPAELLAAAVWFSLITWLMIRTKNFWDCVAAHAVTNLLLGIYVVAFEQWWLW